MSDRDGDGLTPCEVAIAAALWDRWACPEVAAVRIHEDPRTVAQVAYRAVLDSGVAPVDQALLRELRIRLDALSAMLPNADWVRDLLRRLPDPGGEGG